MKTTNTARLAGICAVALAACSQRDVKPTPTHRGASDPPMDAGGAAENPSPFTHVEVAASASPLFNSPRSGVPLPDGAAFIASVPAADDEPARPGVFRVRGGETSLIYAGAALRNPLDLDLLVDGSSLVVADSVFLDDSGQSVGGALLWLPIDGGEPTVTAVGYAPRAVTVADSGEVYFSGADPATGEAGVFRASGESAETLYVGAPLVDPSGIAVFSNGNLLIADTRLAEAEDTEATGVGGRSAVLLLKQGKLNVFASGFQTGYPAGIALNADESRLIVSGQAADSTNRVYVFDVHDRTAPVYVESAFAEQQSSSAGLHRSHDGNTFAWCDRAAAGGTIYTISGR